MKGFWRNSTLERAAEQKQCLQRSSKRVFLSSHEGIAIADVFVVEFHMQTGDQSWIAQGDKSCCSVVRSWPTLCDPMDCSTLGLLVLHHLPELAQTLCPLSRWYHPIISSSVVPFSSCLQSFPASGSSLMNQHFVSGGQRIKSFSLSISPSNEYSGLISSRINWFDSLLSKGLSKVFSNTTVQKHQFFSPQTSLWSNSHIHTWLLEKQ